VKFLGSVLLACGLGGFAVDAAIPLTDSPVAQWNEKALDAIRSTATPPPRASRILAMLHVAIHDACNGVHKDYEQYLVPAYRLHEDTSARAAIATAAHDVLVQTFPTLVSTWNAEEARQLEVVRSRYGKQAGMRWGRFVAERVLAARQADGSGTIVQYIPGVGAGYWVPTAPAFAPALLPQWGDVTPFGVSSAEAFLPVPPPALDSQGYAEEWEQVRAIGAVNSPVRTADQTQIARFWANGAGTATPPGHWNQIARQIIAGRGLRIRKEARLMALLNVSLADAAIVCWKAKYEYNLWRPITAIRQADQDGNATTTADPGWTPLLTTPPFPEYTSGHSTFSGAGATVLAMVLGTDAIPFVGESDDAPGIQRPYAGFWHAAEESGMSRIYGGIHFMSGNVNGLEAGRAVAIEVVQGRLRKLSEESEDEDDDSGHGPGYDCDREKDYEGKYR
jgi:hypothetical protein